MVSHHILEEIPGSCLFLDAVEVLILQFCVATIDLVLALTNKKRKYYHFVLIRHQKSRPLLPLVRITRGIKDETQLCWQIVWMICRTYL